MILQDRKKDAQIGQNYICGEWVTGAGEIENRNPSDHCDVIGRFAQATPQQLADTLAQARIAQKEWAA